MFAWLEKNKHLQALTLFLIAGYGYKATASELNLNTETVREWLYTWKALGSDLYKHPEKASAFLFGGS